MIATNKTKQMRARELVQISVRALRLEAEFGASPVASLRVVAIIRKKSDRKKMSNKAIVWTTTIVLSPNGVVSALTDPWRQRAIRLSCGTKGTLGLERLLRRLRPNNNKREQLSTKRKMYKKKKKKKKKEFFLRWRKRQAQCTIRQRKNEQHELTIATISDIKAMFDFSPPPTLC
jgi:hypothetical protein